MIHEPSSTYQAALKEQEIGLLRYSSNKLLVDHIFEKTRYLGCWWNFWFWLWAVVAAIILHLLNIL